MERSYVPLYQPPFLRPTAPFLIPLESFLFFPSFFLSFLFPPYSFEVYTGCLEMSKEYLYGEMCDVTQLEKWNFEGTKLELFFF